MIKKFFAGGAQLPRGALGARSRKLSNVRKVGHRMGHRRFIISCFAKHVKLLVLAAFRVVSAQQSALGSRGRWYLFSLCVIHKEYLCPSIDNDDDDDEATTYTVTGPMIYL
jgi:hypothetical protein